MLVGQPHQRAHMRDVVAGSDAPEHDVGVGVDAVTRHADDRDAAVGEVPLRPQQRDVGILGEPLGAGGDLAGVDQAGLACGGSGIAQHHTDRVVDRLERHPDRPAVVERHPWPAEHEQLDSLGPLGAHGPFLGLQPGCLNVHTQLAGISAAKPGPTPGVGGRSGHGTGVALGAHPSVHDRPVVERRDTDRQVRKPVHCPPFHAAYAD